MNNFKKTLLVFGLAAFSYAGLISFKAVEKEPETMCLRGSVMKGVCVKSSTGQDCVTPVDPENVDCAATFSIPL